MQIIFNKCGYFIKEDFKIGGDNIEGVNKCKYLGIIMSSGGSFKEANNMLYNNALKASFKLYKEVKSLEPPVNTLLHICLITWLNQSHYMVRYGVSSQ